LGLVSGLAPVCALRDRGARSLLPPLFTCLWFTDPRARVCRPYAHSFASYSSRSRWDRMHPQRTLVGCLHPGEPGSRQPEQYASDPGVLQISIWPGRPLPRRAPGRGARRTAIRRSYRRV